MVLERLKFNCMMVRVLLHSLELYTSDLKCMYLNGFFLWLLSIVPWLGWSM